jgi:hypothetical protein
MEVRFQIHSNQFFTLELIIASNLCTRQQPKTLDRPPSPCLHALYKAHTQRSPLPHGQRLGWIDPAKEDLSGTYITIVWVITLFATISVVTGLKVGIKALSLLGFILGCLILFLCFVMEKSYYLLDLLVQTTGFYLQWSFFQVSFFYCSFILNDNRTTY